MIRPQSASGVYLCGACRQRGACRLGITRERLVEPGVSESELVCGPEFEGGPGVAHGGWTAEAMDEGMGHLNLLQGQLAVTASLTVEFVKPVPVGRPLVLRAWSESIVQRRRTNRAELRLAATGAVLARGHGVFAERDPSHFERHARWLAEQDTLGQPGSD